MWVLQPYAKRSRQHSLPLYSKTRLSSHWSSRCLPCTCSVLQKSTGRPDVLGVLRLYYRSRLSSHQSSGMLRMSSKNTESNDSFARRERRHTPTSNSAFRERRRQQTTTMATSLPKKTTVSRLANPDVQQTCGLDRVVLPLRQPDDCQFSSTWGLYGGFVISAGNLLFL